MASHYILEDHKPVVCNDLIKWAAWMDDPKHVQVRLTRVGPYEVSTVFLGLNSRVNLKGSMPLLFETMILPRGVRARTKDPNVAQAVNVLARCMTWDEAQAQHEGAITGLRQTVGGDIEELA